MPDTICVASILSIPAVVIVIIIIIIIIISSLKWRTASRAEILWFELVKWSQVPLMTLPSLQICGSISGTKSQSSCLCFSGSLRQIERKWWQDHFEHTGWYLQWYFTQGFYKVGRIEGFVRAVMLGEAPKWRKCWVKARTSKGRLEIPSQRRAWILKTGSMKAGPICKLFRSWRGNLVSFQGKL